MGIQSMLMEREIKYVYVLVVMRILLIRGSDFCYAYWASAPMTHLNAFYGGPVIGTCS